MRFIWDCIDRLQTLDVLLLVESTRPRSWTVRQVSDELRSSPGSVEKSLRDLAHHGLLTREGDVFVLRPQDAESEKRLARLAVLARERPTAVTAAIFSRPDGHGGRRP